MICTTGICFFNYNADENNTLSSLWTVDYSGIKRCNDLLLYLGWADSSVSQESLKLKEMQARCMRVFYYNMLLALFWKCAFLFGKPYCRNKLYCSSVESR